MCPPLPRHGPGGYLEGHPVAQGFFFFEKRKKGPRDGAPPNAIKVMTEIIRSRSRGVQRPRGLSQLGSMRKQDPPLRAKLHQRRGFDP